VKGREEKNERKEERKRGIRKKETIKINSKENIVVDLFRN
jgi:hypothetical protein